MTTKTIEDINHLLIKANLPPVTDKRVSIWNALPAILWDKKLSQDINFERVQVLVKAGIFTVADIIDECETPIVKGGNYCEEIHFERIRVLLKAGVLTERDVLEHYNHEVEHMDLSYEYCPLVKILAPLERDGTLYLSGSERVYQLSWDLYLDYIKSIVLLGGRVDHDGLLYWVFDERSEFKLFDYLMDNFHIKPETINYVAGRLLGKIDDSEVLLEKKEESERFRVMLKEKIEKYKAAFEKLVERGIDINLPFTDDDYHSFLGEVFCNYPELFEQYLLQKPSQHIIADLPWEFAIEEGLFDDKQMQLVKKLIDLGYQLPLDEIIELLEEEELDDYANALAH